MHLVSQITKTIKNQAKGQNKKPNLRDSRSEDHTVAGS